MIQSTLTFCMLQPIHQQLIHLLYLTIMNQFAEIANLLRYMQDSPTKQTLSKIKMVEEQSAQLRQLCDMQSITAIQSAVEDRMGPQMCDNAQQADRQQKNKLMDIFKDYEREITESQKRQKQMMTGMKTNLEKKVQELRAKYQQLQQKWELAKEQLKSKMEKDKEQMGDKLNSLEQNPEGHHIQSLLTSAQARFELLYLQQSLSRHHVTNAMSSLIVQLHLH